MDVKYLVLLLMLLAGCMPEAQVGRANYSSSTTGSSTGGSTTVSETAWNYLSSISQDITIDVVNLNNAYIVGSKVEAFLNITNSSGAYTNFANSDYCLVSRYKIGGVNYEARSRVLPISYYDFALKKTVRIFRVDFNDVSASTSYCSGTLKVYDATGAIVSDSVQLTPVFDPALICTTCTSTLNSSEVLRIFKKSSAGLIEVPKTTFNITGLALSVNPNNNSNPGNSCSQGSCSSLGYDCCLDNQCVRDGATRPSGMTTYPDLYQVAEQERLQNPLAYLNYPQLYYICGSSVPTTSGSAGGSSGGTNQDAAWTQLLKDYQCFEKLKSISTSTPWTLDLTATPANFTNIAECTTANPSTGANAYQDVAMRLFKACGCSKTNLVDMVSTCPAYEYSVTAGTSSNPTAIACYTPPTTTPTTPTQQTISMSSRAAPHRFFNTAGNEEVLTTSSGNQEGELFQYLDNEKIVPDQKPFSMNAILGQMSVSLSEALPAKTVNVAIDQVYLISTTSGYYTPCPSCGRDSWSDALTAYPSTQYGVGLQAVGHSTERDGLSTNTTAGNYEDTIFGRACWIPPTMIPFSHSQKSSAQAQRLNRLQTQSALFSNGYQRDWYGFNKGALIGSFDGVTWFAIGKGRIVRSNSKKLFLAINAPFADLANPNTHVVNVQAYDGITQAAQVDYDPSYHLSHSYQNEAGNCQANHMCNTDSDCVSKLGWEYMCADVQNLKTQWPSFDADAKEYAATSTAVGIDQILQQKRLGTPSSKRCVYRGSGSLCIVNPNGVADTNKKKTLTCAPNFYCAQVGSSGVFNSKIARFGAPLEDLPVARNHLFGKDANVLGRPLSYTASSDTTSLLSNISSTLVENLTQYEPLAASNTGLCLPGKALPEASNQTTLWNPFQQHQGADASRRTDYISQIGSCNSTLNTSYRYSSCPVIGADGNYEMFSSSFSNTTYHLKARNQNSCGLDSIKTGASLSQTADNLLTSSPFKLIEGKTLNSQIILNPSLARDACLRRAGQVCQTDLDCGPNKLHAEQVDYFDLSYFGNAAERSYYSEHLVCGQADPKPFPSQTEAFKNYDMTKNRCCREVGNDLTTFTSDIPSFICQASDISAGRCSSLGSVIYDAATAGLKSTLSPGIAPNDPKRYSRLASVENIGTTLRPALSAYETRTGGGNLTVSSATGTNILTANQWLTLSDANSNTCCGGGWVRKFSDGSNNWAKRDRLYIDVSNFRCINSRSALVTDPASLASYYNSASDVQGLVNQDLGEYCNDSSRVAEGCVEWNFKNESADTGPDALAVGSGSIVVRTISPTFGTGNLDHYFKPRSADTNSSTVIDHSTATGRRNIQIKIPSFISRAEFDAKYTANTLAITLINASGSGVAACTKSAASLNLNYDPMATGPYGSGCHFHYDSATRVLSVVSPSHTTAAFGIQFSAILPGANLRTQPGTNSHYLRRLGRFELSGIPQVPYYPLYCNDDSSKVVKGLFKTQVLNRTQFEDSAFSFTTSAGKATSQLGLAVEPVFSQNDFKCCTPLGKTTQTPSTCCSGTGYQQSTGGKYTCALPSGTNLSVYFNRYVTNEGRGTTQPGGGLADTDFDAQTGEPLLNATVQQKLQSLGASYCVSGKVRQGGAFGEFQGEPRGNLAISETKKLYTILDSANDYGTLSNSGQTVEVGYNAFSNGFRWNHHLYCDDLD